MRAYKYTSQRQKKMKRRMQNFGVLGGLCSMAKEGKPQHDNNIPESVEDVERNVELGLVGVVFHSEGKSIREPQPANQTHGDQAIAWR